jgi:hypothetical protein
MNHLLSDTKEAASSLVKKAKAFQISKVIGEDISKVVCLLCDAINRLTSIHKLLNNIVKILLGGSRQLLPTISTQPLIYSRNSASKAPYYTRWVPLRA